VRPNAFRFAHRATGCGTKDDSIDIGEVDRIEADETSVIDVSYIQASVDVAGSGCRYAAVGGAKLGLFMARREGVTGCREKRQDAGSTPIGITGIDDKEEIIRIRIVLMGAITVPEQAL